jgi:hypothetical protein
VLDQHHELAEDLAEIPAVNLIDDKDERARAAQSSAVAKLLEYAIAARKPFFVRTVSLNEVLVRIGLVELHRAETALISMTHECERQPTCDESFPDAGRSLEDHVLFTPEGGNYGLCLIAG